jgi:hypothetical protein
MELQIIFAEVKNDLKAFKVILKKIKKQPEKYSPLNFML